jgi:hypothetical protein
MSDLENMDFSSQLPSIKESIIQSVKFLYNDCYVWDTKLLPYTKQLIALTWFFKEHNNLDLIQIAELKKWFFYTTATQAFQNSSLSNVRKIFRRFEKYIKEEETTAIEYSKFARIEFLDFKFNQKNAQTDLLIISMIRSAVVSGKNDNMAYYGINKLKNGKMPQYYFACLSVNDKEELTNFMERGSSFSKDTLDRLCLTPDTVSAYTNKDFKRFEDLRYQILLKAEDELLSEVGLGSENSIIILT